MRAGTLDEKARDAFLASMTARWRRSASATTTSRASRSRSPSATGSRRCPSHIALMEALEARGLLSRAVEFLPDERGAGRARRRPASGLTRPELAVLLAYAKNTLETDLLASPVLDDLYLGKELYRYFPEMLAETYPDSVANHRLRREVIATVLANAMLNRGGPSFVDDMVRTTSADAGQVASAYAAARDVYGLIELNAEIDALDGKVPGELQLALYAEVRNLLRQGDALVPPQHGRHRRHSARSSSATTRASPRCAQLLRGAAAQAGVGRASRRATKALVDGGVSARACARRIAELPMLSFATDIVLVVAADASRRVAEAARRSSASWSSSGSAGSSRRASGWCWPTASTAWRSTGRSPTSRGPSAISRPMCSRLPRTHGGRAARRLARGARRGVDRAIAAVTALTEGELTVSRLTVAAGLLSRPRRSSA